MCVLCAGNYGTLHVFSLFQVNEPSTTGGSPGELLSRRCVTLLKTALRPDVWPSAELKLLWFDKLLMTVESHSPNFANICTALELLSFLLGILVCPFQICISSFAKGNSL